VSAVKRGVPALQIFPAEQIAGDRITLGAIADTKPVSAYQGTARERSAAATAFGPRP